jgi:hypothetical protein
VKKSFLVCSVFLCCTAWVKPQIKSGSQLASATVQFFGLWLKRKAFLKDEGINAEVIQMLGNLPVAELTNGGLDYPSRASIKAIGGFW